MGGWFHLSSHSGVIVCNVEVETGVGGRHAYYELRPRVLNGTHIQGLYSVQEVASIRYDVEPNESDFEHIVDQSNQNRHLREQEEKESEGRERRKLQSDNNNILDVAFIYTPQGMANKGGISAMNALIHLSVDMSNTAYQNSGIDLRMRLVHAALIKDPAFQEAGFDNDLDRILNQGDGAMDEDTADRYTWGADAVVLFVNSRQYCGLAPLYASTARAYSVVSVACPQSVAHEVGHNIGNHHDRNNAGGVGSSSYNFGWCWDTSAGTCKRSVMAYAGCVTPNGQRNCPRDNWFSSPLVTQGSLDQPTGTVADDNARLTRERIGYVTNWVESTTNGGLIDYVTEETSPINLCAQVGLTIHTMHYTILYYVPPIYPLCTLYLPRTPTLVYNFWMGPGGRHQHRVGHSKRRGGGSNHVSDPQ